ncbi:sh3 domain-containing protein [Rutstroemia sp. NJR-2017a BVV2]|nr:sh3 domain-containing protein [Rutstroemia sp. NJR-2017a BVV2]
MAAVASPTSSPASSPSPVSSPTNPNHPSLPPLNTSPTSRRSNLQRPTSHASKNRLSQYSNYSAPSRSRPPSHIFPVFHSSLNYTIVRDFAYPSLHPMHYGPPPEPSRPPSGLSTPASESHKRLSDPPTSWDNRGSWAPGPWGGDGFARGEQLAPIHFGDGPPWSEDEDLQSPVVVSSRHRKHKSSAGEYGGHSRGRGRSSRDGDRRTSMLSQENFDDERGYFTGTGADGSERYYVNEGDEADGPGGEYRENENELPLVEGQVIWVSYRHGQGWLVAEDPKTQESGLVPEEYVRLLKDIQGGLNSLTGQVELVSPVGGDSGTPTQAEHSQAFGHNPSSSNGSNGYQQPVVSTFSTSSKDLHPYPQHLLGTQAGQAPPQVIHYHGQRGGSQANTPTVSNSQEGLTDRPGSRDAKPRKSEDGSSPGITLSPSIAVQGPDPDAEKPS